MNIQNTKESAPETGFAPHRAHQSGTALNCGNENEKMSHA